MKNKKHTLAFCQIYENDSLKEYLEDMALKGWRLVKIGSMLLHFEACKPRPLRYCVEIMDKASAYASNQTSSLKQYREFCKEEGWDYIGTNGLLHVFCTENAEAVPVETDPQERYQRVLRACRGTHWTMGFVFLFLGLINLSICYQNGTLFCPQGYIVLMLLCTFVFYTAGYLFWMRRAKASLAENGSLPCRPWPSVRLKNNLFVGIVIFFCAAFLLSQSTLSLAAPVILLFFVMYTMMFCICSVLIKWLREKHSFRNSVNILIYWGISLLLCAIIIAVTSIAVIRLVIA